MASMQPFVKHALIFSFVGIATKLILWNQGILEDNPEASGMGYLLFLILTCFFALYERRKTQESFSTYIEDFKYGMKGVALFALIVSLFTFFFYTNLDPEYFPNRIQERVEMAQTMDMETVTNPMKSSKEELIEKERKFSQMIYDPFNHSVISLFIFLMLGGVYSAIITALVRKILN